MVKVAIIDDTHPSIVYDGTSDNGKWRAYNQVYDKWTNEYNSTYHISKTNGSQIAFSFKGTRITVHGTMELPGVRGVPMTIYNIDEGPRTLFNSSGEVPYANASETYSHVPFFTSPQLEYGDHTILITTYQVDSKRRFVFDYFTVEGVEDADNGVGDVENTEGFTIVDDSDARVTYDGAWVDGSKAFDYAQTDHKSPTGVNGSTSFTFSGTSVAVYGRINNMETTSVPIAQLILDEGTSQQQVAMYSTQGNFTWRNHLQLGVWNGLSPGEHTLKVIALGDRNPSWWMDYFVYGTPNTNQTDLRGYVAGSVASTSTSSTAITTVTISGIVTTSAVVVDPDDPSDTASSPSSSSTWTPTGSPTSKGAIAGGVIGALLGLGLLAFLVVCFLRRRRAMNQAMSRGQTIRAHRATMSVGAHLDPGSPMSATPMVGVEPFDINSGVPPMERTVVNNNYNTNGRRPSTTKGRSSYFPLSPMGATTPNIQQTTTTDPNTNTTSNNTTNTTNTTTTAYSSSRSRSRALPTPPPTAHAPSSLSGIASTISSPPLSDGSYGEPRRVRQEVDGGVRLDHWRRGEEEEILPPTYAPWS
ncbi:hypothetical protein FRC19_003837 [Serendipita sp. 401]|nr:hypothetical protein FRC19_003837 [Serendipita sp. 401]KAG9058142.1 hypothetical protein FS842_001326 [Serendipita sp. 407]